MRWLWFVHKSVQKAGTPLWMPAVDEEAAKWNLQK